MQAPFEPRIELLHDFLGVLEASIALSLHQVQLEHVRLAQRLQLHARKLVERCTQQIGGDPAADGAAVAVVMRAIEESLRPIARPPVPLS